MCVLQIGSPTDCFWRSTLKSTEELTTATSYDYLFYSYFRECGKNRCWKSVCIVQFGFLHLNSIDNTFTNCATSKQHFTQPTCLRKQFAIPINKVIKIMFPTNWPWLDNLVANSFQSLEKLFWKVTKKPIWVYVPHSIRPKTVL